MFSDPKLHQKELDRTLLWSYATGNLVSKVPSQHLRGFPRAFGQGRSSGRAATPVIEAPTSRTR